MQLYCIWSLTIARMRAGLSPPLARASTACVALLLVVHPVLHQFSHVLEDAREAAKAGAAPRPDVPCLDADELEEGECPLCALFASPSIPSAPPPPLVADQPTALCVAEIAPRPSITQPQPAARAPPLG
jgi:hypothetical protein